MSDLKKKFNFTATWPSFWMWVCAGVKIALVVCTRMFLCLFIATDDVSAFSVGMCACMCLFVHTCQYVSSCRLSINVCVQCEAVSIAKCVCTSVYQQLCLSAKEMDGKLFVQSQIGCKCDSYSEEEWKTYSRSFFQMGVRNREGWKMMEEKCLQMRETEKEEVKTRFDKERAICFQNSSWRRMKREEK